MEESISQNTSEDNLRQFDVLDDLEQHNNQDDSDLEECSNDSMDSDIPDDEIEAMLEEGLPEEFKGKKSSGKAEFCEQKEKLILDEIGHNHFDVLPEGWVQVCNNYKVLCKISKLCFFFNFFFSFHNLM